MKALLPVIALLSITSCQLIENKYQYSSFTPIHVYSKENKELFLEFYVLDSMNWISKATVTEKDNQLRIKVYYTPIQTHSAFIRNERGNFISSVYEAEGLDTKAVFYEDEIGLHPIVVEEWNETLLNPYIAPKLTDPFERQTAEPVGI